MCCPACLHAFFFALHHHPPPPFRTTHAWMLTLPMSASFSDMFVRGAPSLAKEMRSCRRPSRRGSQPGVACVWRMEWINKARDSKGL